MKDNAQIIYDNLTNGEIVEILANCMEAVEQRFGLRECLTEQTYNPVNDEYEFDYSDGCFDSYIKDCRKYLSSKEYLIEKSRKEKN